ncbi:unnamed protein product [Durusdinium trenchii]|uniref:Uncharacterized protein n=2 Tax=Durusdinium trenchii TaxID=1381693 RepID=A0ABP0MGG3_9DINO
MAAFVAPLAAPAGRLIQSQPIRAPVNGQTPNAPARHAVSSGLGVALISALRWRGRCQSSRKQRVQRWSKEKSSGEIAAPSYPGVEDPKKLLSFAHELCDFFRSSSRARLPKEDAMKLLLDAQRMLMQEETLVRVQVPVGEYLNVVGDVHGQLFDFLSIFEANGWPSEENPFLFNGDFVDRGSYSVEIMLILLAFKLALPKHFFLGRGNHEDQQMNYYYGFTGEVLAKYDAELPVWAAFQRSFVALPLAHVVNEDVFVTHGGLPRINEISLDQIAALDRVQVSTEQEVREEGVIYNDLMWADPHDGSGSIGSQRGGSAKMFGADMTEQFLKRNDLSFIIRSHEVKDEGFEWQQNEKCLTVFSAPQYCDSCNNLGAVVRLHADEADEGAKLRPEILQFDAAEKPKDYVSAMAYCRLSESLMSKALEKQRKSQMAESGWGSS